MYKNYAEAHFHGLKDRLMTWCGNDGNHLSIDTVIEMFEELEGKIEAECRRDEELKRKAFDAIGVMIGQLRRAAGGGGYRGGGGAGHGGKSRRIIHKGKPYRIDFELRGWLGR